MVGLGGTVLESCAGWGRDMVLLADEDTEGPKVFMDMVQVWSLEVP